MGRPWFSTYTISKVDPSGWVIHHQPLVSSGNLYAELKHTLYLDLNIEHSFMVSSSKLYNLSHDNMFPQRLTVVFPKPKSRAEKVSSF